MKIQSYSAVSALLMVTSFNAQAAISLYSIPNFTTLNNSGMTGSAMITLNDDNDQLPTLRVQISATGLDPAGVHPRQFHGASGNGHEWSVF